MTDVPPPIVELEAVQLHHGRVCALSGLSLRVPRACTCAVVGPNGSGKSSLLALLAGRRQCSAGRLRWQAPLDKRGQPVATEIRFNCDFEVSY